MKKKRGCLGRLIRFVLIAAVALGALLFFLGDDEEYDSGVSGSESAAYSGNTQNHSFDANPASLNSESTGADSATVMLYIIGSNLETDDGSATTDIQEMCYAELGDNVNVVLQTGGALDWQNSFAADRRVERFVLEDGQPVLMQDLGRVNMAKSSTVTDFIRWAADSFPADRYSIIFWDHGGGTMMGFGSDEMYPDDLLSLSDFRTALRNAGVHFDFIGFDACLMGTVETGYALAEFADYLIASEETEPGGGWYYSNWLSALGEDPGMNTELLAKRIIDDYVKYSRFFDDTTLSLIKLDNIDEVYAALANYLNSSKLMLNNREYSVVSGARNAAKTFGDNEFEQIDIISYINAAGDIDGADEVREAVENAVVYRNGTVYDANGLAMYYPYNQLDVYNDVMYMLASMGYNNSGYVSYFNSFVSALAYGQLYASHNYRSISPAEQLTGYSAESTQTDHSSESWYDSSAEELDDAAIFGVDGEIPFVMKNGIYVLEFTEAQQAAISYAELQLMVDDGEGYLYMGTDTAYDVTDDGDISGDYDFTWITLDGEQIVPFFTVEDVRNPDGSWHSLGYVPATLNGGRDIEIMCYWDSEHEGGMVLGYRYAAEHDSGSPTLPQRGLLELKPGDVLEFYCEYYTYDGEYDAEYYVGDPVTVPKDGLEVSYLGLADGETVVISFRILDLYQNEYWSEALELVNN